MGALMAALGQGNDSRAIANEILKRAGAKGQPLTIMQLVKLIYFAQGWDLGFRERQLTYHPAQAWQYGPVYPHVYKSFKGAKSDPLTGLIVEKGTEKPYEAVLDDEEGELLDWIIEDYGKMHAYELSRMTHVDGGPWKVTYDQSGPYSEIPIPLMRSYFTRLAAA